MCLQLDRYAEYKTKTQHMIVDGVQYVNEAYNSGKSLISEGANAVMLDVDYGALFSCARCALAVNGVSYDIHGSGVGVVVVRIVAVIVCGDWRQAPAVGRLLAPAVVCLGFATGCWAAPPPKTENTQ